MYDCVYLRETVELRWKVGLTSNWLLVLRGQRSGTLHNFVKGGGHY
jgi:hypothetical protein